MFLKNTKNIIFSIIISIIIAFIISSFLGCGLKDSHILETSSDDILLVGSDPTYPPFEFIKDGEPAGFDIELIKEIANRMDKEVEIIPTSWDELINDINENKIDIAISAIPIDPDKQRLVDFSEPYYVLEYLLVSLSGRGINIKEDLNEKEVGILKIEKGNIEEKYLLNYDIFTYDDVVVMFEDLKNNKISGMLISLPMGINILRENREAYILLDKVKSNREFGIVFKKGCPLKEEVDSILQDTMEDGTYNKIYSNWFEI